MTGYHSPWLDRLNQAIEPLTDQQFWDILVTLTHSKLHHISTDAINCIELTLPDGMPISIKSPTIKSD